MGFDAEGFDRNVPLPTDLKISHIRKAIEYIEREATDLIEVYFEQANVFSGLVGIFGVRALHSLSPYKKHKHPDVAQQRFPDMSLGRQAESPSRAGIGVEGNNTSLGLAVALQSCGLVHRLAVFGRSREDHQGRKIRGYLEGRCCLPS